MTTFRGGIFCSVFDIAANPSLSYHDCINRGNQFCGAPHADQHHRRQRHVPTRHTGAFEVLARVPSWTVDLVAVSMDPVRTDLGLTMLPTKTRESAKPSDILVIPGGRGIDYAMLDDVWIAYARREAAKAKYVLSVCTGSHLLAAAGCFRAAAPADIGKHVICSRASV